MDEFQQILAEAARIARENPSHVFIGGMAVYLHAINNAHTREAAEATDDVDLMVALTDFADLRDTDELVSNRRCSKHLMIRRGVEFDIYVERQHGLVVPYDDAAAYAVSYDGMRAASLEHLLVLKLEALRERVGSAKGDKDERDLVTIAEVSGGKLRRQAVRRFVREEHIDLLDRVGRGTVLTGVSRADVRRVEELRTTFSKFIASVARAQRAG